MNVKPILFNPRMVRAIRDGRKTQTRRVVKGIEGLNFYRAEPAEDAYDTLHQWDFFYGWSENGAMIDAIQAIKAPCSVGDVLWVRETWNGDWCDHYIYKADGGSAVSAGYDKEPRWRPSIHMPRDAARIFLRVTDVRVERLQDITPEEVEAEGTDMDAWYEHDEWQHQVGDGFVADETMVVFETLCGFFGHRVWDNTMQSLEQYEKYGWDANPWVWVIEFEQCGKPDDWGCGT